MSDASPIDRPTRIIFVSGVFLIAVAAILGSYLATPRRSGIPPLDWHLPGYDERFAEARTKAALAEVEHSANVHALMWMTFGLGVALTLYGLRLITRPDLRFQPLPPIGSSRDLFENRE